MSPAQAALEDFAPGHACWGLVPDRVPCRAPATLAVVARPPTLLWHDAAPDGMLERRAWRWDPESRGWGGLDKLTAKGIERRLCGAVEFADEFAGDDEAGRRAARKHRGGAGRRPIAVLKVAPGAASVAGDARRAADNAEGDAITAPAGGSPAGHSCSFYRTAKAARAACRALLRNEPQASPAVQRGAAAVALQRYVAPKGPAAWMVRAVVDAGAASNVGKARDQGSAPVNLTPGPWAHGDATKPRPAPPRAWVFNEAHEPVCVSSQRCLGINGSAPPCSVVTSVPGSGAWRDAKAAAAALLGALNRTLPPSLSIQTLAADFVQDDRGSWWLLQIRGCRGRSSKFDLGKAWRGVVPAASPAPRPDDIAEAAGDASGPPCSGEWCDVEARLRRRRLRLFGAFSAATDCRPRSRAGRRKDDPDLAGARVGEAPLPGRARARAALRRAAPRAPGLPPRRRRARRHGAHGRHVEARAPRAVRRAERKMASLVPWRGRCLRWS